jgi:transcriptional regulator with XRE-family HTH domain
MNQITKPTISALFAASRCRDTYWIEAAKIDFTEEVCKCMEEQRVSRKELAKRLNSSPAYITKILRGNANFTLESMVKISRALGGELRCHLQPEGFMSQWFDVYDCKCQAADEQVVNLSETIKQYSKKDCSVIEEDSHATLAITA